MDNVPVFLDKEETKPNLPLLDVFSFYVHFNPPHIDSSDRDVEAYNLASNTLMEVKAKGYYL